MTGIFSIPNTFQTAVTATGLQLDTNFNTLTAYILDPTNRNNYAADTGTTNSFAISLSPAAAGYTAGLGVTFKAATANSGASQVNANALGPKNLFSAAGAALAGGEITVSQIVSAVYDGTQFQMTSPAANSSGSSAASQAEQEAASSTTVYASPGRQQFHPSAAKFWCLFDGTAVGPITPTVDYNVDDITDNGTGNYTVNITTDFSGAAWAPSASSGVGSGGATDWLMQDVASLAAGSMVVRLSRHDGSAQDSVIVSAWGMGDQ